jgi:hypothetical protein
MRETYSEHGKAVSIEGMMNADKLRKLRANAGAFQIAAQHR